jgi:P-type Cu+ transporter
MKKEIIKINGMHCVSCSQIIENRLKKVEGIKNINVSYTLEKAEVEFDEAKISENKIYEEIEKSGYKVDLGKEIDKKEKLLEKIKIWLILPILVVILGLIVRDLLALVWPGLPSLPIEPKVWNWILLGISTFIYVLVGKPFLKGIINFVRRGVANMDTLIGIGTGTAFVYSTLILIFPEILTKLNLPEMVYFDAVIGVIGFVTLGKYLESRSKEKTGETIKKLLGLQAKTALVWRDNKEIEVPLEEVVLGEIVLIKPGFKIPVDGIIMEGKTSVDESMINGEAVPVDKKEGDKVIGATINKQGFVKIKTTGVGEKTVLAQIIKIVEEAQNSKAPVQKMADKISGVFVPIVLVIAGLTFVGWLIAGSLSMAISSLVGVLVVACPCALGLATPTAIIAAVGRGAEEGILIKNALGLENLAKINTIVFDKTGTITKGEPRVTNILSMSDKYNEKEILIYAASVEKQSEHPLAKTIVEEAKLQKLKLKKCSDFESEQGVGVVGKIGNKKIFIKKLEQEDRWSKEGKTVVVVEIDGKKVGKIGMSDTLKENISENIEKIEREKIEVLMLTGDNKQAAEFIAKQAGINEVIANVLPGEKSQKIKELQILGKNVAMVGDGINDAPALVQAEVGIAMSNGSDIAIESAQITILKGDISKVYKAWKLSKITLKTIKENLFWAFIYNLVGIPIAAGLLYPIWGIQLNPIFAGMAMSLSSVSVVTNSLRLKWKKID